MGLAIWRVRSRLSVPDESPDRGHRKLVGFAVGEASPLDQRRGAQDERDHLAVDDHLGRALLLPPAADRLLIGGIRGGGGLQGGDELERRELPPFEARPGGLY